MAGEAGGQITQKVSVLESSAQREFRTISLVFTPKPKQDITNISDLITESCNWLSEGETESIKENSVIPLETEGPKKKMEENKETKRSSSVIGISMLTPYYVPYSKEVEHYFQLIFESSRTTQREVETRELLLPSKCVGNKRSNKTLLLDLDDTLIHTINPSFNYALLNITHSDVKSILCRDSLTSQLYTANIVVRPYARQLLKELSPIYEIVIFTAAQKGYADAVLQLLDPKNEYIDYRIYRDKCIRKEGFFLKHLGIFSNRELKNMVILDNSIAAFSQHLDNGVHVPSFFGNSNDSHLMYVIAFLEIISGSKDVRKTLRTRLGISNMYNNFLQSPAHPSLSSGSEDSN